MGGSENGGREETMNDLVRRLRVLAGEVSTGAQGSLVNEAADKIIAQGELLADCLDALLWCSGSNDFQENGMAHVGWEKCCRPLIAKLRGELWSGVTKVPRENDEFLEARERSLRKPGAPDY